MRKILIFCVSLGVLVLAILFGPGKYRAWRSERAFHNAEMALSQNREKEAILSLQEALQSDPKNLPATRLMASILEKLHSSAAIMWHRRLSQLAPEEAEPRLAWLRDALGLRDSAMARAALESFPENQKQGALFHHLASSEALMRKDWTDAESHAAEAVRLNPGDAVLQLNLASVRLQSNNPTTVSQGQAMLVSMQQQEKTGTAATRVLITDALRRGNYRKAADLSKILTPSSSAGLEDRIQYLSALDGLGSSETNEELKNLEAENPHDLPKNIRLLEWMLGHNRAAEALVFLQQLPPASLDDGVIRILRCMADAAMGQWPVLEERLKDEVWEENDYMREAFLARAYKETGQNGESLKQWKSSCKSAAKLPQGLYLLASTVQSWPHWEDETLEVMWMIADGYRYPVWALQHLHAYYLNKGETRSLYRVAKRWSEVQSSDPVLNNLAQYSLLINQDVSTATALALANFKKHPDDPAYTSTYAFALYQSGKKKEALETMSKLKETAWKSPELCAYQAIFLAGSKRNEEADQFKKKAEGAALLPEERDLLEKTVPNQTEIRVKP